MGRASSTWVTAREPEDRDRIEEAEEEDGEFEQVPRDVAECLRVMNAAADTETGTKSLLDSEIISLVEKKHIPGHQLEKALGDPSRGVRVRRKIYMKHGNLLRERGELHAGAGGGGGAPQHGQRQPVRADGHDRGLPGGQHQPRVPRRGGLRRHHARHLRRHDAGARGEVPLHGAGHRGQGVDGGQEQLRVHQTAFRLHQQIRSAAETPHTHCWENALYQV